jgi:succinate dehydrogenase / fumarate reductase cytochrome b subunit
MSPHTSIWKWHITMASSILHRVTGVGNYIGIFIVVAWLFVTTTGKENYDAFSAVTGSLPGLVILFGFTLSVCYHLLNGIRHLFMDTGAALNPKTGSVTATRALLAVGVALYHMRLGMQVVIEDYIAKTGTKLFLLILNTFICVGLFAAAAFSVLEIAT